MHSITEVTIAVFHTLLYHLLWSCCCKGDSQSAGKF